ncbi:MAG: hypothetical protein CMP76_09975 [Flavobacterium sp.]|uniref:hypothetical protein n=1 Tax=Flavobacterium sp. TaxID=239 RepID=UPI000C6B4DFA|nr:hypothetical protein [Flavobacterium sp.]MBF03611.1 hypothetical protein [Flavobacterium sp.]|tara:strand:- start:184 stop:537 length:354 start_codon:yes stop_codon:yes gene_type:complete
MEKIATNFEMLLEKAQDYTKSSIELFKLNAIDKSADITASLTFRLAFGLVVAMFSLFINIGISLYIGKLLGETYLGFLIVSGFYLVLAILIFVFRKQLIKVPITNMVIRKLLETKIR